MRVVLQEGYIGADQNWEYLNRFIQPVRSSFMFQCCCICPAPGGGGIVSALGRSTQQRSRRPLDWGLVEVTYRHSIGVLRDGARQ